GNKGLVIKYSGGKNLQNSFRQPPKYCRFEHSSVYNPLSSESPFFNSSFLLKTLNKRSAAIAALFF
ncbi:MAG: hypothetical protein ABI688_06750, partial [Bacteroidota bacterium]